MKSKQFLTAVLLWAVLLPVPAFAQNTLTRTSQTPVGRPTGACGPTQTTATPVDLSGTDPVYVSYCSADNWPAAEIVEQAWRHEVYIDNLEPPVALLNVHCAGATPYPCVGQLPAQAVVVLSTAGAHRMDMTVVDEAGDRSPRDPIASLQLTQPAGCTYVAPGSTTSTTRPRYTDDPVGGSIQGFNPMAGQSARIAQLRAWGWKVEWQFVDGSGRDDKVDRLFLMVFCDPPTVQQ